MSLNKLFRYILSEYSSGEANYKKYGNNEKNKKIISALKTEVPRELRDIINGTRDNINIKGGFGQGNWAKIPWVVLLNENVTRSPQSGYYVVYLFNINNKKIYLSLNQGVNDVKKAYPKGYIEELNKRSDLYRTILINRIPSFPLKQLDNFDDNRARDYAAGHVLGFEYDEKNMPKDYELAENLKKIMAVYSELILHNNIIETFNDGTLHSYADEHETFKNPENLTIVEQKTYRFHRQIDRTPLSKSMKKALGVDCQCCGINFKEQYGDIGENFIEIHHLIPLAMLDEMETKEYGVEDFAALCPNCHRMIHRQQNTADLKSLKNSIKYKFNKR